jgi:ribosome-associated protein
MALHTFPLDGEFIELNVLLKLLALAPSGGAAKAMIAEGLVSVDNALETRKARKLRIGQVVRLGDEEIHIVASPSEPSP